MTLSVHRRAALGALTLAAFPAALAVAVATTSAADRASAAGSQALVGTFHLTPGRGSGNSATGSYFRMLEPGATGYFSNPDSSAANKTYTPISPGNSGGFVTGGYQPSPSPAFDSSGNSRSGTIIRPQTFAGIRFGLDTVPVDPQSHKHNLVPSLSVSGTRISGQLQAWTAEWNKQYFNQGAPKPGSSGAGVTGTYNPTTHAFVITWKSTVAGGPFDGFTGYWHLTGTFHAR